MFTSIVSLPLVSWHKTSHGFAFTTYFHFHFIPLHDNINTDITKSHMTFQQETRREKSEYISSIYNFSKRVIVVVRKKKTVNNFLNQFIIPFITLHITLYYPSLFSYTQHTCTCFKDYKSWLVNFRIKLFYSQKNKSVSLNSLIQITLLLNETFYNNWSFHLNETSFEAVNLI